MTEFQTAVLAALARIEKATRAKSTTKFVTLTERGGMARAGEPVWTNPRTVRVADVRSVTDIEWPNEKPHAYVAMAKADDGFHVIETRADVVRLIEEA